MRRKSTLPHRTAFAHGNETKRKIENFMRERGIPNKSEAIREIIVSFFRLRESGIDWEGGLKLTEDGMRKVIRYIVLNKPQIIDEEIKRLKEIG